MRSSAASDVYKRQVVSLGLGSSFVVADIPGLIEGAAQGAGLGIQFLRHLTRTKLLLHLVEIAPYGHEDANLAADVATIVAELEQYSLEAEANLSRLDRWLVINKTDTVLEEDQQEIVQNLLGQLSWEGPVYQISAIGREGTQELCNDIMAYLQKSERDAQSDVLQSIPQHDAQ